MTPTPQQIKAALDDMPDAFNGDETAGEFRAECLKWLGLHYLTVRALLQQAMDEGMVRVPKVPPHKVISKMGDLAQSITLSKEYPWPRYMMDLYSIALTAADAGEVKP